MWRQRDEAVRGLVVLVVVVVVGDKVAWCRAQHDPVEFGELRLDGIFDGGFVDCALGWQAPVEHPPRCIPGERALAYVCSRRVELRPLIPVHMVAYGDGRIGRERPRARQQAAA